ncbi:hypothetical protein TRFO_35547 [Tritrichomonas foetus]|uniref:Uncharacterized protein n=1 Tax=Tritrichomonas foetus TaxID=1144522 RepID=A0A1J4JLE0_9EUKA|nr:hypothetical protein TRFO_35547 [Tritrichomonas foetus]|eukprot:OHS98084.1 hypothetical protein TRFO_35547 [Tritrichomonas foetus]
MMSQMIQFYHYYFDYPMTIVFDSNFEVQIQNMKRGKMREIEIETSSSVLIRRIDGMSSHRKYYMLLFFFLANLVFIFSNIFGPPFFHSETIPFDKNSAISNTRKFVIKIGDFNFLNDFIAIDLILMRQFASEEISVIIESAMTILSHKGKRYETLYQSPSIRYNTTFPHLSTVSNKIRLYTRSIVDFVFLESNIVLKFPTSETLSGVFVITYNDTTHSIIEVLIRLIFFFAGIGSFFYLFSIDKKSVSNPMQLQIIQFLIMLLIISSNPLYVLAYFTESLVFSLFDVSVSIIFILAVAASFSIILDMSHTRKERITPFWIFIEILPFLVTAFLYLSNEYITHYLMYKNEDSSGNSMILSILRYLRSIAAAVCFIIIMISMALSYSINKQETKIYIFMVLLTFIICFIFETYGSISHIVPSAHEIQIFTFASVATFLFFFAYMNWPISHDIASDDSESASYDPGDFDFSDGIDE